MKTDRRRFLRQSVVFSALAALEHKGLAEAAAPVDPAAAQVLLVGDWGWDRKGRTSGPNMQTDVAAGMRRYVKDQGLRPQALLMLGDNWYGDLTGGAGSPRWQSQFEEMYPPALFDCPAYAVLGNHDYQRWPTSKVDAELEYARSRSTRWTLPARWYRFEFPRTNPLITFLALDSNMPFRDGAASHGRDYSLTAAEAAAQQAWLEEELARPRTTPYLAVMAHHPIYSNGHHGDHGRLIRDWDPLLRRHRVDLYLAGHDHDLQHLEFEGHPTTFFLSGGGGADLASLHLEQEQRGPFSQKVYGFSHLSVTDRELTLSHLDIQGRTLHALRRDRSGAVTVS